MPNVNSSIDPENQLTAQEPEFLLGEGSPVFADSSVTDPTVTGSTVINSTPVDSTTPYSVENSPVIDDSTEQSITGEVREATTSVISEAEKARGYLKQYLLATSPEEREVFVRKIIQTKDAKTISEAFDETTYTPGNTVSRMLIDALINLKVYTALVENFVYMTPGTEDFKLVVRTIAEHGNVNEIGELIQLVSAQTPEDRILTTALEERGITFDQWIQEARARAGAKAKHF